MGYFWLKILADCFEKELFENTAVQSQLDGIREMEGNPRKSPMNS